MNMIYWDHYYNHVLLVNLMIVIGLFTSLRLFSGTIAHVNASDELLKRDNPAFGISLAAATFAMTIMLSGTVYGSPENDMLYSVLTVGVFGIIGIFLMALTRLIFDKITLRDVHLRDEIVRGNKAVAIVDAGNVLAAAVIVRAVMVWITVNSIEGAIVLFASYAVSQILLTTMTFLKIKAFERTHAGTDIEGELKKGNIAVALVFAGKKIGTAFAIATAAQIVVYEEYDILPILGAWLIASVAFIIVWKALSYVATKIILFRVNLKQEIVDQRNLALGALQAVIYVSIGILMSAL